MKPVFFVVLALLITSCSGYFEPESALPAADRMNALALADGSGYLSTDNYNEITPFIFKNTNTGKKYLFFSSDRGGNYDIYYAEMNADGKFARPVKMGGIASAAQEYSPVLFVQQGSDYNNHLFISFIRVTGQVTNVETYHLNADLSVGSYCGALTGFGPVGISYKNTGQLMSDSLLMATGETNWLECMWDYMTPNWVNGNPVMFGLNEKSVTSVASFMTGVMNEMESWMYWYVFSVVRGGKNQIYAGGISNFNYMDQGKNFYHVGPYSSIYNDKDPVVDVDDAKLYFSSDRYGKGNYDLYRHNVMRYELVKAPFLDKPEISVISTYPEPFLLGWTPVAGATHYRVYEYNMMSYNYVLLAEVTGTSFFYPSVNGSFNFKIQAVGNFGYSEGIISDYYGAFVN